VAEGVTVRGHWAIEVQNPDGTLNERYEFPNEVHGHHVVAMLFAGSVIDSWWVGFRGTGDDDPCVYNDGSPVPCYLYEAGYPGLTEPNWFSGLTVGWEEYNNFVVLSGSFTVSRTASIATVESGMFVTGNHGFSAHTLATPIPVEAGQQVQVSVTLTIS